MELLYVERIDPSVLFFKKNWTKATSFSLSSLLAVRET